MDIDDENEVESDDDDVLLDVGEEGAPPAVDEEHVNPQGPAGGAAENVDGRIPPIYLRSMSFMTLRRRSLLIMRMMMFWPLGLMFQGGCR